MLIYILIHSNHTQGMLSCIMACVVLQWYVLCKFSHFSLCGQHGMKFQSIITRYNVEGVRRHWNKNGKMLLNFL